MGCCAQRCEWGLGEGCSLGGAVHTCSTMKCGTCTRFEPSARRLQGMRGSAPANSFRTWQNSEQQLVEKQRQEIVAMLSRGSRCNLAKWACDSQGAYHAQGLEFSSTWFLIAPINISRHPETWTSFKFGHWRSNRSAKKFLECKYFCTDHSSLEASTLIPKKNRMSHLD